MAPSKEVAKSGGNLPAEFLDDLANDSGMGMQNTDKDDMIVPFVKLAQALSDEVKKTKPEYIEGLEEGDFFNNATNRIWKREDGFKFVPVLYERQYLQFTPREDGGGFHGEQPASILSECTQNDKGQDILPNGDEIVTTGTWFVLVVSDDGQEVEQAVISCAKSQFTQSRKLMSKLKTVTLKNKDGRAFNPPSFYNVVSATSLPKSNDQGDWMVWDFSLAGNVFELEGGADIYNAAKMMAEDVASGKLKSAEHAPEGSSDDDTEVPF